eukprot:s1956_g3.t1
MLRFHEYLRRLGSARVAPERDEELSRSKKSLRVGGFELVDWVLYEFPIQYESGRTTSKRINFGAHREATVVSSYVLILVRKTKAIDLTGSVAFFQSPSMA